MSLFPSSLTKRRTVYTLLLVWFFALGSGWANACLLQVRETHLHGPSEDASSTVHASRVSPGHVGVDSDHAENAGPAKSACLKVCGDDTQTIVKLVSSVDLASVALITHVVDGTAVIHRKRSSMLAHGSQIGSDHFMAALPLEAFQFVFGSEWFIVDSLPDDPPSLFRDLFQPLEPDPTNAAPAEG